MAEDTITGLAINSLLVGVLALSLISGFILLVENEGRGEIFDDYPEIQTYKSNLSQAYQDTQYLEVANVNTNISAEYNPETTISGSDRSGNAIAINLQELITVTWASVGFLGSVLFGNVYTGFLSGLVIAVIGYLGVAYIIKSIRTGYT